MSPLRFGPYASGRNYASPRCNRCMQERHEGPCAKCEKCGALKHFGECIKRGESPPETAQGAASAPPSAPVTKEQEDCFS